MAVGIMWCIMQPVEVTELIHQLAANIGCHIAVKPRDDFASWREWRVSEAEKKHLMDTPLSKRYGCVSTGWCIRV
jgi:hypothetical protein